MASGTGVAAQPRAIMMSRDRRASRGLQAAWDSIVGDGAMVDLRSGPVGATFHPGVVRTISGRLLRRRK